MKTIHTASLYKTIVQCLLATVTVLLFTANGLAAEDIDETPKGDITISKDIKQADDEISSVNQACRDQRAVNAALEQLKRYYETGDVMGLQSRLDPAMVGYLNYVEAFKREAVQFSQRQLNFTFAQYQCGPDVAVVSFGWEKRFTDAVSFRPGLLSGSSTILFQRDNQNSWRMIASAGDNLFSSLAGSAAALNVTGSIDVAVLFAKASPAALKGGSFAKTSIAPVTIEVVDADLIGKGTTTLIASTDTGDVERLTLLETTPGRFVLNALRLSQDLPTQYNNSLEILNARVIEFNYVDEKPGQGFAPKVLRSRVAINNNSAVLGPNPFNFVNPPAQPGGSVVTSNVVTISGLTGTTTASATAPGQLLVDGISVPNGNPIRNGQTVAVRLTAANLVGAITSSTVSINGLSASFSVTTAPVTGPNPFSFNQVPAQNPGVTITSNAIVVSGLSGASTVTATAPGQLVIDGVNAVSGSAITNGQTVAVRLTAPFPAGTLTTSTVTINGVSATFSIVTATITTPNLFVIPTIVQTGVTFPGAANIRICAATLLNSTPVTITGINTTVPVTVQALNPASQPGFTASATSGSTIAPNGTLTLTASKIPNNAIITAPSGLVPIAIITVGTGAPVTWNLQCN